MTLVWFASFAEIRSQWTDAAIPIKFWSPLPPPGGLRTEQMGLLEASFLFVANAARLCKLNMTELQGNWQPLASEATNNEVGPHVDPFYRLAEYRFILENEPGESKGG